MAPRNADEIVTALGRSMRRVRMALALYGVPCLIALAGLGFRSTLTRVSPRLPDVLEIAATLGAVGLLLVVLAGWQATRRALRQLDLRLRESTARLALARQEIEAARNRRAIERRIETLKIEHEVASREARLRIRELEQELAERRPRPADPEPAPTPARDPDPPAPEPSA